jgi:hypothetical protein
MAPISNLRTSQSFQQALSRMGLEDSKSDEVEAGEEFAPTEDLSEVRPSRRKTSGQVKRTRPKSFGEDISDTQLFLWCLLVILSGFYFMFWRQEKFLVGFCGVPQSQRNIP